MTEEPASAQDRSTKGIALIPNVSVKTVEAPRRRQLNGTPGISRHGEAGAVVHLKPDHPTGGLARRSK